MGHPRIENLRGGVYSAGDGLGPRRPCSDGGRMVRWCAILVPLAACGSEQDIVPEALPVWPDSRAPDVPPVTWTDRLVQLTVPQVDVLWTIDNSSSMGDEQQTLIENFPGFADFFVGSGLDYHIGVVTTDLVNPADDGTLRSAQGYAYIDP